MFKNIMRIVKKMKNKHTQDCGPAHRYQVHGISFFSSFFILVFLLIFVHNFVARIFILFFRVQCTFLHRYYLWTWEYVELLNIPHSFFLFLLINYYFGNYINCMC